MKHFEPSQINSILIIQFGPFGDVLLNTGYLNTLKQRFPQAKIDFLVSKPYDSVLYQHPALNEIDSFAKKKGLAYMLERLKVFVQVFSRRYSLVIDQQCGTGSGQVVIFSRAKYRLGFANSRFVRFYNLVAQRGVIRYSASTKFDILAPLGISEEPYNLYYYIKPESHKYIETWIESAGLHSRQFICLSPGSPLAEKVWSVERYAQLADKLIAGTGLPIVVLWAKDEFGDAQQVCNLMQNKSIMAPATNLNQAAALLKHSRLLICNDGGLNHVSAVTDTPSVAMFGPTRPIYWCPGQVFPLHLCLSHPELYHYGDNSFGIEVEEAYQKVMQLVKEISQLA